MLAPFNHATCPLPLHFPNLHSPLLHSPELELLVDLHQNSHRIGTERFLQKKKKKKKSARYSLMPHALPLETIFVVSVKAIRSLGRQGGTKPLRGICYDDSSGDIRSFYKFFVEDVLRREKVLVESGCNFTSKGKFRCGVYGRQSHIWEWFVKSYLVWIRGYGNAWEYVYCAQESYSKMWPQAAATTEAQASH